MKTKRIKTERLPCLEPILTVCQLMHLAAHVMGWKEVSDHDSLAPGQFAPDAASCVLWACPRWAEETLVWNPEFLGSDAWDLEAALQKKLVFSSGYVKSTKHFWFRTPDVHVEDVDRLRALAKFACALYGI